MMVCQVDQPEERGRHSIQDHGVLDAPCPAWKTVPTDASSLIPPALDRLRQHPEGAPEEGPGLLERLAQVPSPRDPRGVRHALVVALALSACAVLAGATSILAVGEWITDAPPHVLEHVGVRLDPLFPKR